jgi:hypothetical protein
MSPTPYGTNQELDDLYAALGVIEEREIHAIEAGRPELLSSIRQEQLPLKRQINQAEGIDIYPEATPTEETRPAFPHDVNYEKMPDGTIHRFRQPIRCF